MSARWTFVRHAESEANAGGWLAGHTDVGLTERGVAEARALAGRLADVPFDRVLVSDLKRTRDTLALALPDWSGPVHVDPRLRERTIGDWDGQLHRERHAMELLIQWHGRPPGGESLDLLARRALGALDAHDAPMDTLVVTHGGLMRVVLGLLDGHPVDAIGRLRHANCAVESRSVAPGTWARLLAALPPPEA